MEEKIVVMCPSKNCHQKLRLPKTDKVLRVVCPKCHTTFRYKFPSILNQSKSKWYYRSWFIILLLFLFTPVGIILLWSGPKFRFPTKIGLSVAFGLLFIIQSISNFIPPPVNYTSFLHHKSTLKKIYLPSISMEPVAITFGRSQKDNSVLTIPEIVKRVGGAIVSVESQNKNHEPINRGSGVVVHSSGIIITNYHVLSGAYFAIIKLKGDEIYRNVFLANYDKQRDLAVLKIKATRMVAAPLGNSDSAEVGEKIIAIGNPLGYERSVSDGIISGMRKENGIKYLQTTTPISPGSSGGALLNMHGEVIGITS
ncbi:MAG: trypsin-like peptidase domain-containing protein, partial [Candidatus Aerophobetes bacterium]|nr:trypsin-like peptidase domain-containing protein [Candidatus Aerophobetes bacterium]